jgi:hypothetical protein
MAVLLTTLAVVLVCGGAIAGFIGLAVFGNRLSVDGSRAAVTEYLTALRDREFDRAYSLLCPSRQHQIGHDSFVIQAQRFPITGFTVGQPKLGSPITVPATINPGTITQRNTIFSVEQDQDTGDFEVCGGGG